jgi:pyruvate/2-oxoglutarate/acetoin dehydrogenase E1 component
LVQQFGNDRVINTPIAENAIAGVAIGAAWTGMRPVAEIMFADFLYLAMDQVATSGRLLAL